VILQRTFQNGKRNHAEAHTLFRFGLRGADARSWLAKHPLDYRSISDHVAQEAAVEAVLSNCRAESVILPNFSRIVREEYGFSRVIFKKVLKHMCAMGEILWDDNDFRKSTIRYLRGSPPKKIVEIPACSIIFSSKNGHTKMKLNTIEKRTLDRRIRKYWDFIATFNIQSNVDNETYAAVSKYAKLVKKTSAFPPPPDDSKICPVAVYNDRSASIGGRFYRAFWINESKTLRRLITIDGELTSDVDGDAMHVQLLYQYAGEALPEGELYLYSKDDPRRSVTKKLMLYMMNTRHDWKGDSGRVAVIKTYKRHNGMPEYDLMTLVEALEQKHAAIRRYLYKSNWGQLQNTEAGAMLQIMEMGMEANVPVLPVHDGCLCKRSDEKKVLGYFGELVIRASINRDHFKTVDVVKMQSIIRQITLENLL